MTLPAMDPGAIQQHLDQAERHAAEGRQLVARQERLVTELRKRGHNTTDARKVLETLRAALAVHDTDVQRLSEELENNHSASVTSSIS
jgi:hypothetical protein